MQDLGGVIRDRFRVKNYDLAQSTYALYYTADPIIVLDVMRRALKPGGRLAVCVPNNPHGLVEFVKTFTEVAPEVESCGTFGPRVLEPYFRQHFWEVTIHLFHNVLKIPTVDKVMEFLRNSAYYVARLEDTLSAAVERRIRERGHFDYEKNSYLIVGENPLGKD